MCCGVLSAHDDEAIYRTSRSNGKRKEEGWEEKLKVICKETGCNLCYDAVGGKMPGVMIAAWCIEIVYDFIKEGKKV